MKLKEVLPYLLFIGAVVVVMLYVAGFIDESTMLLGIGLLGFPGLAALRTWIESSGYKTYIVAALGVIGVVAYSFGFISPAQLATWLTIWGLIGGATTAHAAIKAATKT